MEETDIIISTWTYWMKDGPCWLTWQFWKCVFLAITVQMGHNQRDTLEDYWLTLGQYFMAFYGNTMKWDRFHHILRFLHFSDNKNEADEADENYDQLWKMRAIFDKLNGSYA